MLGYIGAQVFLLLWIPLVLVIFMILPARRAAIAAAVGAWLYLPPIGVSLPGLPDYNKTGAAVLGILLATIVFEPTRLFAFRPRWFDLPILVFTASPFFSSISNGLGAYDGVAGLVMHCLTWLLPYWIGRLYLTDAASFREFGLGMIIGGMSLIPFCLIEFRLSQIFQPMLYGFGEWEGMRFAGYRPRVFFQSGLALGLWMNAVTLVAWWFWYTRQFKRIWGIPGGAIVCMLLLITIMCRATGATLLLAAGFLSLIISIRTKTKWALWCLLCVAPFFYTVRSMSLWSGESAVELLRMVLGDGRADSLDFRLENDDLLIAKALQQPIFGWGGWTRNRVFNEAGDDISVTDGYWIVVFGMYGYVGLISMSLAMLLPAAQFLRRFPIERWNEPNLGSVVVIAVILDLFLIDCLVNAMPNVIYVIAAGGLFNVVSTRARLGTSDDHDDDDAPVARSWEALAAQHRARGRASKNQGDLIGAKTAWLHALDLYTKLTVVHPRNPAAHQQWCDCANDLAWLLVNAVDPVVDDPACALSLAIKTTEAYPQCSTYWNTLGASYYRTGDFKAASEALGRSLTFGEEGTAFDYIYLTMTHAQLGNQEQAHRWFAKALRSIEDHYPDHPELGRLRAEARSLLSEVPETSATVL